MLVLLDLEVCLVGFVIFKFKDLVFKILIVFVEGKTEHFKEILDVNVLGLTICTQQALKLMKSSGVDDGHIININR